MTLEPDRKARYDREWKRFRRLRAAFWLLGAGFLLMLPFVGAIRNFLRMPAAGFFELVLAYAAMLWVSGYNVSRFPCPRCGRVFAREGWFGVVRAPQHCHFCKLPLWGGPDDKKLADAERS